MFKEFIRDFLKGNKLVKGTLEVGGRKVDLMDLTIPILNIFAEKDHIVPPPCTVALGKHVGIKDYTALAHATGHIGIHTGGLSQKVLAPTVGNWMRKRGA